MNDKVSETLQHWRKTAFIWGVSDCLISLADYLIICGYDDFAIPFRNTFEDEYGANEHIENYGGEDKIIDTTGLLNVDEPVRGDIVLLKINDKKISGLCTGKNIAFRTMRGVVEIKQSFLEILKAWKVDQCHQSQQ